MHPLLRPLVVALALAAACGDPRAAGAQNPVATRVRRKPVPGARPWLVARPSVAADLGAARYTGPFGRDAGLGPTYGFRAGAEIHPALRIHARWQGASHGLPSGAIVSMTSVALEITIAVPLAWASPFVASGAGWYEIAIDDPDGPDVDTPASMMIPISAGLEARITRRVRMSAEVGTRVLFSRQLDDPETATTQALVTSMGARLVF